MFIPTNSYLSVSLLYHNFVYKSRRKPCMESAIYCGMESDQRSEWNHGNAVYGIKPQELYFIRASRNAMRDFVGVPYNAWARRFHTKPTGTPKARTLASGNPYCGLDNKKTHFCLPTKVRFLLCKGYKKDIFASFRLGLNRRVLITSKCNCFYSIRNGKTMISKSFRGFESKNYFISSRVPSL